RVLGRGLAWLASAAPIGPSLTNMLITCAVRGAVAGGYRGGPQGAIGIDPQAIGVDAVAGRVAVPADAGLVRPAGPGRPARGRGYRRCHAELPSCGAPFLGRASQPEGSGEAL